jgi:transposase
MIRRSGSPDYRREAHNETCWAGLIKLVSHDGVGLYTLTKRLEQGQLPWPSADTIGRIALSAPQLAALLDECEWWAPVARRKPELAG